MSAIDTETKPRKKIERVPATGPRVKGVVKWFNDVKGFGFISPANGPDVFVHFSGIEGSGHRTLVEGQEVEFSVSSGAKGEFAVGVTVTRPRE